MAASQLQTSAAIEARELSKHYGSIEAVRGIDLEVATGETVALLGPNGAGKSTTIDMILGLLRPDGGAVSVFGGAPSEAIGDGLVGAMLQSGALIRDLSVRELIAMVASLYPQPLQVDETLALTGLEETASQRTQKLSGGQTQRVRFAVALVSNPRLLDPRRADGGDGRRGAAVLLGDDARAGRAGQDDPVRDPLPRGGRRLRRPRRADGRRADRGGRAADPDQGDGRRAHDPGDPPGGAARRISRASRA